MTDPSTDPNAFVMAWFESLAHDLTMPSPTTPWSVSTIGELILEVLTDAANELFVAGLLAAHLRRHGRKHFRENREKHFWVRSEWQKFDVCFGLATERFSDWNAAWMRGTTGDLGTIELKLVYEHFTESAQVHRMSVLADQLADRKRRVVTWRKAAKLPPDSSTYHGLVLHVGSGAPTKPVAAPPKSVGLCCLTGWKQVASLSGEKLRETWPRSDLPESLALQLALFS